MKENEVGVALETEVSKRNAGRILRGVFSALIAALGLLIVIYYIWGPGVGYLHADCTDTLYWAKASYDSGKWISDDFRYAALLPFGGNLLMLLFMPVYGFSIMTHNLGMTVFALLFGFSVYSAARSLGMGRNGSFFSTGSLFLAVSASDKMREIFWGHVIYYSLGIVLLMFGIALVNRMRKNYRRKRLSIWLCIGVALYFSLVALDGGQMLVLVTLPIIAAVFLERFLDVPSKNRKETGKMVKNPLLTEKADSDEEKQEKASFWNGFREWFSGLGFWTVENKCALILMIVLFASVPVGLIALKIISHGVTAGYAQTYSTWVPMKDWADNLLKLPIEWFRLFGLDINARKGMFSVESVGYLIELAAALVISVGPVFILFQYPKIKNRNIRFMLIVHFTISAFILVGYICGMLATANWRLSPMIVTGMFLLLLYLEDAWKQNNFAARFTTLAFAFVFLFCFMNAQTIRKMDWNYNRDKNVYKVADFMEEEGLSYGFATFWNSQLITMYTGEAVKARNMIINDGGHKFESYQSEYSWGKEQEGQKEYFLLFTNSEYSKWMNTDLGQRLSSETIKEYHDIFGYVILVFDHLV